MKNISLAEARRIAIAAHGFARSKPRGPVTAAHIGRAINSLGLLQLDYVNVLVPAHLMVLFSRLGTYNVEAFHRTVYRGRAFTEQWAHEACIVPSALWPLLEHRRSEFEITPRSALHKIRNKKKYLSQVIEIIRESGSCTVADMPPAQRFATKPGDWRRPVPRTALDYHFGRGNIAVADRLPNFQRAYDLTERLIDDEYLSTTINKEDAQRALLKRASRACGIATLHDLADYYRMSPRSAAPRIEELVEDGSLQEVRVEGWSEAAFLAQDATCPRSINRCSLLSPFDPLVWFRPRAQRLFDFHYRIEIYVPAAKRRWGYYVLPFLQHEKITARVDLKADRKKRALRVLAAHPEDGIDTNETAANLARELYALAAWLGLETVVVVSRTAFARCLESAVRESR